MADCGPRRVGHQRRQRGPAKLRLNSGAKSFQVVVHDQGEFDREQRERVWKTVDRLNATLGRGTVRILSAGPKDAAWKLRAEHRSPRWTTRWEELPAVRAR